MRLSPIRRVLQNDWVAAVRLPRSCSRCRGTKAAFERVRHCAEAVVTPESENYLTHRSVRFYDCYVAVAHQTDRSLRTSAAATEAHTYANRPAGRPPRGAVLLICQPSREAEWRFCGVGRPAWMPGEPRWAMDGPWRRAHGAEPERGNLSAAKAVRWGESALVTLPLCKVTRCKSETNIPVIRKCRICTRWISYLQINNAPVANQARAALVRYQRV